MAMSLTIWCLAQAAAIHICSLAARKKLVTVWNLTKLLLQLQGSFLQEHQSRYVIVTESGKTGVT